MPTPTTKKTVLCVDDDPDDREIVCTVIQEIDPSIEVIHAENGIEAHEILKSAKEKQTLPCLIILDVNMPKMDGKETLIEIKKDDGLNSIPVVMFTTSNSPVDKMFFSAYGVDLVTKPNEMSRIHTEVKALLHYCAD
jgi:CheY-like chemotaxis protein